VRYAGVSAAASKLRAGIAWRPPRPPKRLNLDLRKTSRLLAVTAFDAAHVWVGRFGMQVQVTDEALDAGHRRPQHRPNPEEVRP
jgi:hypothetical protein